MYKNDLETTFDVLISPLSDFFEKQSEAIDSQAKSRSLFFIPFVKILIFGIIMRVESLRKLVTQLETNAAAGALKLPAIPFSTLQEAFTRFPATVFHQLFLTVLATTTFITVPEIQALGTIWLIDGSLFPLINSMDWATYNNRFKAVKLHLAFELNRMIPVQFMTDKGSSSEKKFLASIIQPGITFVMDRGYISFQLFAKIFDADAFFICRVKENLKYTVAHILPIDPNIPSLVTNIRDFMVTITNDSFGKTYRLITFTLAGYQFLILTNRLDLSTFQIIVIYAYRWQIELIFRFFKYSLKALQLFSYSKNGVQIFFNVLLLTALLQLKIKQVCFKNVEKLPIQDNGEQPTRSFILAIGNKLSQYWKITTHWIIKLQNSLALPFNWKIVTRLGHT